MGCRGSNCLCVQGRCPPLGSLSLTVASLMQLLIKPNRTSDHALLLTEPSRTLGPKLLFSQNLQEFQEPQALVLFVEPSRISGSCSPHRTFLNSEPLLFSVYLAAFPRDSLKAGNMSVCPRVEGESG